MTTRPCPACASRSGRPAFSRDGFAHLRCRECATLFVSPLPSADVIRAVYEDPSYRADAPQNAGARRDAMRRARVLATQGVRSVLEIGCGEGEFLEEAAALGIEAEAVEPGPVAERLVARGLTVHQTWLDRFEPTRQYDAVAMWEVVEHLPDPFASLSVARQWLVPGGVLALSTPSSTGLPARLLGSRFPLISPPEHLELFSHRGLRELLKRVGFAPSRWQTFSNLDSDTIARGLGRYFLGDSVPGRACAKVLGRLAVLPARAIDRAGLGTGFEVYARPARHTRC